MSDQSPILNLPYILPAQAQKHVSHNEALRILDAIVQLSVQDRILTGPPAGPNEGDRYIVAAGALGAWAGHGGEIALFGDGQWGFFAPQAGWQAWVVADAAVAVFDGAAWVSPSAGGGGGTITSLPLLGISATADSTNRLSVSSDATLFNNAGAGHQMKLNKASTADTASLLFQTGFSGRAEMGTAGSDGFAIKVSADGASFADALTVDPTSGIVSLPQGVNSGEFALRDSVDVTRQAVFVTSGLTTGTTRSYTLPNVSSELAVLSGTQTFSGVKSFSGTFSVSSAAASIGTNSGNSTYGLGVGATNAGATKTVNLGTDGVSGSTTVVNLGSAVAGAGGALVINSPSVTFANSVTSLAAPQTVVQASQMGLGGASSDVTNRFSINTPAVLFNHAGAGIEAVLNKTAASDAAVISFKTGFSTRAVMGLDGVDDFALRVSPDGVAFTNALSVAASDGAVTLAAPVVMSGLASDPVLAGEGTIWHNATSGQIKAQLGGQVVALSGQSDFPWLLPPVGEFLLTTSGCGASTSTTPGAAGRIELYPYLARGEFAIDQIGVNVTTAVASALGKIIVYAADQFGRPDTLLFETATLDFSTVGAKTTSLSMTFLQGSSYWFGIRHSSTATLSAWQAYSTPDINGGPISTLGRKTFRRTLAFATAATANWGYNASEASTANATSIWLRRA